MGVNIYLGHATFTGLNTVEVNGKTLEFTKACIATGGRPTIPKITGLSEVPYYTSDTIFNLRIQPKKMLIVGGGPIGAELGQAFQRLGTQVTFILRGDKFLPKEDRDAAQFVYKQLVKDGCSFMFNNAITELKILRHYTQSDDGLN
jgi:pyruvate/2-oxoglutarate dehydrogenase complex dihydrolipoamide dehydrogenase (E3) component